MKSGGLVVGGIVWLAVMVFGPPVLAGDLNPPGPPGPTMKTLDQIPPSWDQKLAANDGGADGCNSKRFKCVMDGEAVLDKETGLVWERTPSTSTVTWGTATCILKTVGGRKGWRVPTVEELASLVDPSVPSPGPALPAGHPFAITFGPTPIYWSATGDAVSKWGVRFDSGLPDAFDLTNPTFWFHMWCVRGGGGHDGQ
jgi:uncharacterized protein DUF1566